MSVDFINLLTEIKWTYYTGLTTPIGQIGVIELCHVNREEWHKIAKESCQGLVGSMPRRVEAVIKAKGSHTKH